MERSNRKSPVAHQRSKTLYQLLTRRFTAGLIVFSFTGLSGVCDDRADVLKIVRLLNSEAVVDWSDVKKVYRSIDKDSAASPLAKHTLVLLAIKDKDYSRAWRMNELILAQENQLSLDERCIAEKRKLWLLLEAGSKDANHQFALLIDLACQEGLDEKVRQELFRYLGGVIAMARMPHPNPVIKAMTLDRSESVLREFGGEKDLARYSASYAMIEERGKLLEVLLGEFATLDTSSIDQRTQNAEVELKGATQEKDELNTQLEETEEQNRLLKGEKRELIRQQVKIVRAWNTETPGRPSQPQRPSMPKEPKTVYKRGSRNLGDEVKVDESATRSARQEYDRDMETYRRELREYESDVRTYPKRLEEWEKVDQARREQLVAQKANVDVAIADQAKQIDELILKIAEKRKMCELAAEHWKVKQDMWSAMQCAKERLGNLADPKQHVHRPSSYPLIDWSGEQQYLEQLARRIPR